ncbi:hypothetical protein GPALN_007819 [Globodera pallida]|nr:hypothetical protein GPALN_007819 [Globodera pallida]
MANDMHQSLNKIRDDPQCNLLAACFKKLMAKERTDAQKLSGQQARELLSKRQEVREELGVLRENLNKTEMRIHELQPTFFKQSAKVPRTTESCLRVLCESLFNSEDLQQQNLAELEQCSFDQAIVEFQRSRDDNILKRPLTNFQRQAESQISPVKHTEEAVRLTKSKLLQTKQKLDLERAKRGLENKQRGLVDLRHTLDIAKQKHQATANELNKFEEAIHNPDLQAYSLIIIDEAHEGNASSNLLMGLLNFDQAIVEFQRSRDDNILKRPLTNFQRQAESQISAVKHTEEAVRLTKSKLVNEINELESIKGQLQTKQKLDLERAKRGLENKQRGLVDLRHTLDIAKQKHKRRPTN